MHFCSFDVETTGLEAGSRIIEIAAIKRDIATGNVLDTFCEFVNPQMPVPEDVRQVNGINPEWLVGAHHAGPVLDRWLAFIAGSAFLTAHFAPYDVGITSWELDRWALKHPDMPVVDTCELAKAVKETPNNKLPTLVQHYGITTSGDAHRAQADAEACASYYLLASKLAKPVSRTWQPDHRYVKPVELPKHLRDLPDLVAEGKPFPFEYTDAEGTKSHRTITPYGWSAVKGALMFHGLCHTRGERRTFRADRVDGAAA